MRDIDKIIVHCTATREGAPVSLDTVRRWHLERGWSDIGYHYLILLDGTIERGRPEERQGAHVRSYNKNSIGVAYVGGLDRNLEPKDTRTQDQKDSLHNLLSNLMASYEDATLHGHNEFSNKACPSFNVSKEYDYIINLYER
tara:strand:- start:103 stop:528 length:426 start_codon:yes stop_codon:yes gene_type:complete